MVFSDTSTKKGLVEDTDRFVNTDATSYPLTEKAAVMNNYLDEVVSLILNSDGRWEWDDSNQTDLPIGTTTLIDGQADYNIAGATFLKITRVELMNVNGDYELLTPITESDIRQGMSEFQKTNGMPKFYDKIGDSVILYPTPSSSEVTLAKGLKVYFQRLPSYFASNDTTKAPGFNPLFHRILSVGAALDYAVRNEMVTKVKILDGMLSKLQGGLVEAYTSRSRDEQVRLSTRKENYGAEGGGYRGSDKVAFYGR